MARDSSIPPLVGAKDSMGDCKTHAGYVINGLKGEIVPYVLNMEPDLPFELRAIDI